MGIQIEKVQVKYGEAIKINNFFLHSKYNPEKEAKEFINKNYRPEAIHIILGYGQGYFVDELVKVRKYQEKILVIEPYLEIHTNKSNENNVFYTKSIEHRALLNTLNGIINGTDTVEIIISPNYEKIDPSVCKSILTTIKMKLHTDLVNENTINLFADKWHDNYLKNLQYAIYDRSLVELHNKFGYPVVIASGGPSLTKQIEILKKYRNKILLIASGSTINSLVGQDIYPDFVVSIDGLVANYNHFKDSYFDNVTYLYSMQSYPKIREQFSKQAYYFLPQNANLFARHLKSITGQEPVTSPGGASVANYAFAIATFMSSGPIALIGQDLAYTNNQTHASFNKNAKVIDENLIKSKNAVYTKGYYGDEVLTNYPFLKMKENFVELNSKLVKSNSTYNCTEGGAYLDGFEQIPFKEFCEKHATEVVKLDNDGNYTKDRNLLMKLIKNLENELDAYNQIKKIYKKNLDLLSSNKAINYFDAKILKKMNQNDLRVQDLMYDTSLGMAFNDVNIFVLKYFKERKDETAEEKYNRIYLQSETLYKKMEEATDRGIHFISKILEELKEN